MNNSSKKLQALLFLVLMLTNQSCEIFGWDFNQTELEKLPSITQTGRYNFGCLVNGKAAVIWNSMLMRSEHHNELSEFVIQFSVTVDGKLYSDPKMDFNFRVSDLLEVGVPYPLVNSPSQGVQFVNHDGNCIYEPENTFKGFITFSNIDRTKYIISGTFEFSSVTQNCETVTVTNGRFDLGYYPY